LQLITLTSGATSLQPFSLSNYGLSAFYFSPERPAIWAGFYWVLVPFWSFFGGGVILKPTSLWSFFIAFAALAGGFQLIWETQVLGFEGSLGNFPR